MSYDVSLVADLGGKEPAEVGDLYWNYTSNVAPMWREAMPETDGLAAMDGMQAGTAAKQLRIGIARMNDDPEKYRAMNPENRWGDFDGQLTKLVELATAFEEHPKATVRIYR